MPKINVYLPDDLAEAVREAQLPVSAVCQAALERAVRDVTSARGAEQPPAGDRPGLGLFARFTPRARKAVTLAEQGARAIPHSAVGTGHVLLGIIDERENLAVRVLTSFDIELDDLRAELVASMDPPAESVGAHIPFSSSAKRALELTVKEALALGHNYIGCEHLLLSLLATDEGTASKVLRRMGLELRTTRRAVVTALTAQHAATTTTSPTPSTLEQILRRLDAIEARLAT
jgi:ATP-dependent Clp protease ATP-binding subunit ClpA